MDTRVPPVPMDRATEALRRSRGQDTQGLEELIDRILSYIHFVIPDPPASSHATLSALLPHDGVDRISRLPDVLLRNIVSRLPIKDAARTTALSCRWRGVWHSTPLVLVDADLFPSGGAAMGQVARADGLRVTSAISRVLAAHPGPFRCVHLTSSYMGYRGLLTRWFHLLAVKGVRELVLVNRPWPLDLDLPATFFGMATLTRLYLGFFKFPDTTGLPRAAAFPHLRELGLCTVAIEKRDIDFVLARCPVLEILCIQATVLLKHLHLVSRSLRCVQIIGSMGLEIVVQDAPHLERLIIWSANSTSSDDGSISCNKIKIGHAPALSLLGYLDPETHVLEIRNTIIKAGTRASPSTMVPSVKILGLKVRFGIRNDAKILPSLLRCFPNVEKLHLKSQKTAEPTGKLNLKFWQEAGAIECVQSHMKLLIFCDFRGERSELAFLKFFLESARMLTKLVIVYAKGGSSSMNEVDSKVKALYSAKWASEFCSLHIFESAFAEGQDFNDFKRGSDFSFSDPFAYIVRAPFLW